MSYRLLVHESINLEKKHKTIFESFKTGLRKNSPIFEKFKNEDGFFYQELIKILHDYPQYYEYFCDFDEHVLEEFLKRLKFFFSSNKKSNEIVEIKEDISHKLKEIKDIEDSDCEKVRNKLVEMFFESTLENIFEKSLIDITKLYTLTDNIENENITIFENILLSEMISIIEESEEDFNEYLKQFNSEFKENLKHAYICFIEKFIAEAAASDNLLFFLKKRYGLTGDISATQIINAFIRMSILTVFADYDLSSLKLYVPNSIDNLVINDVQKYCLKSTTSDLINTTEIALGKFIKNTLNEIGNIKGFETVVFKLPRFEPSSVPCKYPKEQIKSILSNIAQVRENEKFQKLYCSLNYRCTECLQLKKDDSETLSYVKKFSEEGCNEGNN